MLEKGHYKELHNIIERVNSKGSKSRRTFIFSATLTLVHELPDYLLKKKKNSCSKIQNFTSDQKLQQIIDVFKIKNPKIIDVTKNTGSTILLKYFFKFFCLFL